MRVVKHINSNGEDQQMLLINPPLPIALDDLTSVPVCLLMNGTINTAFYNSCFAVCDYFVHEECKGFSVSDCKNCATYLPTKEKVCILNINGACLLHFSRSFSYSLYL